jgi:hypothetical protein
MVAKYPPMADGIPLCGNFRNRGAPVKTKLLSVKAASWHTTTNLRNEGYQLNQLKLYTYFINKLINLYSSGM